MGNELAIPEETYGPAMSALTQLQRNFVDAYLEHPNYNAMQLAEAAGYAKGPPGSTTLKVTGHRLMHDAKVLAAMNEEAGKRLQTGGVIGVTGLIKLAMNEAHKDHLKACIALADRTGFHALSEHKVTVDDKRPQSKAELIAAIKMVAAEAGLDEAAVRKLTGEDIVDGDFKEVTAEEEIKVEDL